MVVDLQVLFEMKQQLTETSELYTQLEERNKHQPMQTTDSV